ncbi:MAG: hypothetical protein GX895_04395 [Clostridiales bacterium]|uniref:hypothetical protein n=1 Tax=Clostridium sp. N3C TaxID=1776758 RepID=UPI00092E050F|nr:hypothetical protein [Clostridium sp. N3C]NLZ48020.1 hypothetical protein [Clostridiales bacterium]SCN23335.1 hypothetical protein N3C_1254 [Clostridium sp. N3C]
MLYNGIVIFGEMGAGKDALAAKFVELRDNAKIYNMGVLCREMMKVSKVNPRWKGLERYIGQTVADKLREMDINIMCDYILSLIYESGQKKYGWDNSHLEGQDFDKAIKEQLSFIRKEELSIIVGGRTLSDLHYWKDKGYLILGIRISPEIRKKRLINRDGEEVVKNSNSNHNTEVDVPYILDNLCHEVIYNDGTLEELKESAEKILIKYNF